MEENIKIQSLLIEIEELKTELERQTFFNHFTFEAAVFYDENNICIDVNPQFTRLMQYEPEEIIGTNVFNLLAPSFRKTIKQNILDQKSVPYEGKVLKKDGSEFRAIIQGTSITYNGKPHRIATCRDISEVDLTLLDYIHHYEEYETIFNNSLIGIMLLGRNREMVKANETFARIFGYDSPDEIVGKTTSIIYFSDEHSQDFRDTYFPLLLAERQVKLEYQFKHKDGHPIWLKLSGSLVDNLDPPDLDKGIVWICEDISLQKAAEIKLEEAYAELENIFENAAVGIYLLPDGKYISRTNKTGAEILGFEKPKELEGMSLRYFHLSEEHFKESNHKTEEIIATESNSEYDYPLKKADGSTIWVAISAKAVRSNPTGILNKGLVLILKDITKRKEIEQKLQHLSRTDELTGIDNRRYFLEQGKNQLSIHQRYRRSLCLLMLDIDHFKKVNDSIGHTGGDRALCHITGICQNTIRKNDIIGRLGGEEFGILLLETDMAEAIEIAERIRTEVMNRPLIYDDHIVNMTISIGVTNLNVNESLDQGLLNADRYLYLAKESGRNMVSYDNSQLYEQ
jgi:diguanylate cyclase (GGDEF)-like protein/PAS domain S-box-containing protein